MAPTHPQDEALTASLTSPQDFWLAQAAHLKWDTAPTRSNVLHTTTKTLKDGTKHPHWTWFKDTKINTTTNCLDRHVEAGLGSNAAIIYDSPVTGTKKTFTYAQVLEEVELLAAVLREEGVKQGDRVLIYMPMIPQALFACLAVLRLGAVHAVVFGGFSGASLAQRIEACGARVVLTASCGIEGGKGAVSYKPMVRGAVDRVGWWSDKGGKVLVFQRPESRWDDINHTRGERNWGKLVRSVKGRGAKAGPVPMPGDAEAYIIYTSGTTGAPKGVVRQNAGHLVGLSLSIRYLFGMRGPGDVMFCASDIGWVVGHSYILYAPLLAGATTVLFEGKPIGTPDAGTFWRIINEHRVNILFTAPTALRGIRREDPESKYFKRAAAGGGLRHLRALFLAGERSEPSIITQYTRLLEDHCAPGAQVVDHWWSSESGSPISGLALLPPVAQDWTSRQEIKPYPTKPGSAGKAMPGFDVRAVDDDGNEVKKGEMGNIVLGIPLAPTGLTTLWQDDDRFYRSYLKRFGGRWVDTGDAGMVDADGYIHIMSRADDVINVAAHRFSTGAIEQAVTSHPSVAEACVVGIPDSLKGHLPFAFMTLNTADHPNSAVPSEHLFREVQSLVREQIGPIASLGGMIQGKGMIPKTRSGKTLRRVLRELTENAVHGEFDKSVQVPATVEDAAVVEVARGKIKEYFLARGDAHKATEARAKL